MLKSFVSGEWMTGVRSVEKTDPAHPSTVVSEVSLADAALATSAIEAARAAFGAWRATPAPARGEILRRAADILERKAEQVARDLTREEGKTLGEALGETRRAVAIIRYQAGQTLEADGETFPSSSPRSTVLARREPLGVVSVITPWNFPISIPAWKIAPALAYGNTVVWKPADLVSMTAVHFMEVLIEAGLPPGVVNLVLGSGREIGDLLVTHPTVDGVTFTGSNAVGTSILSKATALGKKVQLEMGGKNPAIVLGDADLDFAAEQVARGAFLGTGQKCTATSRVIVDAAVLPKLRDAIVSRAEGYKVGDPQVAQTAIGPLASEDRLREVSAHVAGAASRGGRILTGGPGLPGADGHYFRPTVIDGSSPSDPVSREEIFGPVAVLLPVASFEEAVALANDTTFGLSASVFTNDLSKALRFIDEVRAGMVKINQETNGTEIYVPFGGMKGSSAGPREQGKAAREFFTQWKTIYITPR